MKAKYHAAIVCEGCGLAMHEEFNILSCRTKGCDFEGKLYELPTVELKEHTE